MAASAAEVQIDDQNLGGRGLGDPLGADTGQADDVAGILTNQNSSYSEQSKLWRQEDGSVKATVFEGKTPREVIVRPKKPSGNFDQSKIPTGPAEEPRYAASAWQVLLLEEGWKRAVSEL